MALIKHIGEQCQPDQQCNVHIAAQARAKELRLELLNSERLKAHFEAHPGDLALLRHDKVIPPPSGNSQQ
jgi:hypothetical protein